MQLIGNDCFIFSDVFRHRYLHLCAAPVPRLGGSVATMMKLATVKERGEVRACLQDRAGGVAEHDEEDDGCSGGNSWAL